MSVLFKRFICILFSLTVTLSLFLSGCKTNVTQTNVDINTPEPVVSLFDATPVPSEKPGTTPVQTPVPSEEPGTTPVPTPAPSEEPGTTPVQTPAPSREPVTAEPATEIPCTAVPAVIPNGKTVYLTYDDGPCHLTTRLLDMLDEYNIKATFFTVGFEVERHPEIVRDAASRGHLIACHTYSHNYKAIYSSADAFMADVHRWEEAVKNVLGTLPEKRCLRFPGGSTNSYLDKDTLREIIGALTAAGYNWYDWNIADNDKWLAGNTEKLPLEEYYRESYLKTLGWAEKGDKPLICIAHDTCPESIEFQRFIIEDLIQKGYSFATLESCPD